MSSDDQKGSDGRQTRRSRGARGRREGRGLTGGGGGGGGGGGDHAGEGTNDTSNSNSNSNSNSSPRIPPAAPTKNAMSTTASASSASSASSAATATATTATATATNSRGSRRGKANNNSDATRRNASTTISSTTTSAVAGTAPTGSSSCPPYPRHLSLEECLARYEQGKKVIVNNTSVDTDQHDTHRLMTSLVVRGKLRVLPGSMDSGGSFVSDDCPGCFIIARDVWIPDSAARNRALDGDIVYVEVLLPMIQENSDTATKKQTKDDDDEDAGDDNIVCSKMNDMHMSFVARAAADENLKTAMEKRTIMTSTSFWQDDTVQMDLWNPTVPIVRPVSARRRRSQEDEDDEAKKNNDRDNKQPIQRVGRVIGIVPPAVAVEPVAAASELLPSKPAAAAAAAAAAATHHHSAKAEQRLPTRTIVGHLKVLNGGTTVLLTPYDKSLPQFKCPAHFAERLRQEAKSINNNSNSNKNDNNKNNENGEGVDNENNNKRKNRVSDKQQQQQVAADGSSNNHIIYQAEYEYYSWKETHKWPPCRNVRRMGQAGIVEDEIQALLTENKVDHGEFPPAVVQDVQDAVQSGLFGGCSGGGDGDEVGGWKPTKAMYHGRRDYRNQRIFTIDPTTAKDLDDALHMTLLDHGIVEVGVHIADVSYFVRPRTAVDQEAQRRATTVYLVDRTIPMLPRPLCEVACSLNENVERLAFSCVWKMNLDGTMLRRKTKNKSKQSNYGEGGDEEDVWYGRTVIKSCARLDYATAQNIIDGKVPGKDDDSADGEELWPKSRRPTGGHTMDQVASDVRLMHRVAMARRRMRFENGALALHGVKITFQLDKSDGQTPLLAAPYPIRDSNRLVEEFMLLANYLVAQRLITHAGGRALLRHHPEPLEDGLDDVVAVAKAGIGFDLDITTSATLHASLNRLARECNDPLVLLSVTQMLMNPMRPADYIAAGSVEAELWRHFALNIPYYTHFTSPIRRYPDVMVHRLLQATIDGEQAIKDYPLRPADIEQACEHCNEKRMASKAAQERCDRVFLSIYVTANPLKSELGIVLSVGMSTFTVLVPSIGVATLLFLEEHSSVLTFEPRQEADESRTIVLRQKPIHDENSNNTYSSSNGGGHVQQQRRWNMLEIRVFTKLTVTVYGKEQPPIDVKLRLEGPWRE